MSSQNILVIDDEEAVRDAFVMALEDTKCQVDTAACGEEGIEQFNQANYSLIYLDLKMPGINGVETLTQIRKVNETVPIYIVTAFSKEFLSDLQVAREKGLLFEILKKPLGADQIVEVTESILNIKTANDVGNLLLSTALKLKIYVAGITADTQSAIESFKEAVNNQLNAEILVTIIDVLEHPDLAADADILATPTLIRELPAPLKKLILNFNCQEKFSVAIEKIRN
ncbi:MAG: response regulator [Pseudomonadales bacterium]